MEKVIIVRYCEIYLKGKNRSYFENLLADNIKRAIKNFDCRFVRIRTRYLIEKFKDEDYEQILSKLLKICGVYTISPANIVPSDLNKITECAEELMSGRKGTFKVETNRADKKFPIHSLDVSREVGGKILDKYSDFLTVDVKNPETTINIDIRECGDTLIFTDIIKGIGGMPTGSSGKGVLMISGGIDSPVAGYMMAKRGMRLDAVHFHSYPYTGEAAKEKVITLSKKISEYSCGIMLYVVKFTHIQEEIHLKCAEELMITMMRRFMMKITERIAEAHGGQAIITGESLGQVASQTIESITSSNSVVKMPVLRPLIAFDKLDTIEIANRIDTFNTSILPYEDCCTVFLPKYPAIKPKMEIILREEAKLDVEGLITEALNNIEIYDL